MLGHIPATAAVIAPLALGHHRALVTRAARLPSGDLALLRHRRLHGTLVARAARHLAVFVGGHVALAVFAAAAIFAATGHLLAGLLVAGLAIGLVVDAAGARLGIFGPAAGVAGVTV